MPTLYLIPSLLAEDGISHIPPIVSDVIKRLDHIIAERIRTVRRFIKQVDPNFDIDHCRFIEMNKHEPTEYLAEVSGWISSGTDIGLISEAGCPCIADPGSRAVDLARTAGYNIAPLTGPSSIMLALMASGLNGQNFSFHGYLPIKAPELSAKIKQIATETSRSGYTQIFIETPYRNAALLQQLKEILPSNLRLCIAQNLTSTSEEISTKPINKWDLNYFKEKVPAIFLIGK